MTLIGLPLCTHPLQWGLPTGGCTPPVGCPHWGVHAPQWGHPTMYIPQWGVPTGGCTHPQDDFPLGGQYPHHATPLFLLLVPNADVNKSSPPPRRGFVNISVGH
jgi:hypothetical protein